jgi:tyrosine-protein kinase Etk/Wzc
MSENTAEDSSSAPIQRQADAVELISVLVEHKRVVVGIPAIVAAISLVVVLLMPKTYLGVARVLPMQQNQSMAMSLLSQVGGGALAGLAGPALGLRSLSDLYVGILKSRTIADALIDRFKLQDLYGDDTLIDTRITLENRTTISSGRDGIISIEVEDKDPGRAAAMANAYTEELEKLNQNLAISEAGVRRAFFERQLRQVKEALADSEGELRAVQEKSGLIKLEEQGRAIIEAVATLRGQIAVKEVQLVSLGSFATTSNPEFTRVRRELAELREQLEKLEKADSTKSPNNIFIPTGKVPEAGMQYVRKLRDVKYNEVMFEVLAKQYELARLDEAKDAVVIQVVDKAVAPDKKHKPKRALIVMATTFLAFTCAVVWVFLRLGLQRMGNDPVQGARLKRIKDQLFALRK